MKFANQWKCRIPYNCTPNLTDTLHKIAPLLYQFRHYRLEQIRIEDFARQSALITEVFDRISRTKGDGDKRGIGPTATSKILHMVNPHFFMMYDKQIREGYVYSADGLGYSGFMLQMRRMIDEILQTYSSKFKIEKTDVAKDIAVKYHSEAQGITKLVDEYNWIKFNPQSR